MSDFLLYMVFSGNYYTLVGGIRTINPVFVREYIESDDFSSNNRIIIPGSGKKMIDISASGVANENPNIQYALLNAENKGTALKARLESENIKISGLFLISSLSFSESFDTDSEFTIELLNSGPVTIEPQNLNLNLNIIAPQV